jgi:hypothetical protein
MVSFESLHTGQFIDLNKGLHVDKQWHDKNDACKPRLTTAPAADVWQTLG